MKKLIKKLDLFMLKAMGETKRVLSEDRGDTNFISIAIILVVVIAVAVVFIGFKDRVVAALNKAIEDLFGALGA